MKILSILVAVLTLSVNAADKPYHLITCYSDSEGWIEALVNKEQSNDQMLRIYTQGGLGPNSLEASFVSVGNNNQFAKENNTIQLSANYSTGLKLSIEYSVATLSTQLGGQPAVYRNCRLE